MEKERLEALTLDFIRTPSINGTAGEAALAERIHGLLAREEYFRRHPERLRLAPLRDDGLGRANVLALVQGEAEATAATVVLHGHLDTVGVDDFGELAPWAFDPPALKERFRTQDLPPDVRAELLSPDWLCGRGSLDMKSGLAVNLGLLIDWARAPGRRRGNLLFMANPVEENQHTGIIEALPLLAEWQERYGLNYVAAINNDYTTPLYPGDPNHYVYTGTVGKLLPCFYILGRETHVGQCFEGFDPALLAAEIARELDLNPALADEAEGEVTLPPAVLKLTDLKRQYTVQTPGEAFLYCNYLVHGESVAATLTKLKQAAEAAFARALGLIRERYQGYVRRTGLPEVELPWTVRVRTFAELYAAAQPAAGPALATRLTTLARQRVAAGEDKRLVALDIVRELALLLPERLPQVVIFFAPPYCPHNFITREEPAGARVLAALGRAGAAVAAETGVSIKQRTFFPSLSDSSYLAMHDSDASLTALRANFPAWDILFPLPVEAIRRASIPALNLGTYGKDGHKFTERVYKPYTFGVLPRLLEKVVEELLASGSEEP